MAVLIAALLVAVWFTFEPALAAGFVNWDDGASIVENTAFRGFSAEHLRWMFTTTYMGPYQPLSWLSLALDHAVGRLDPAVYHRTNLIWHAVGTIALFFLARRFFGLLPGFTRAPGLETGTAFVAALLFALHPLRCESVCWVTERRDVLSAPFFFLSLYAWIGYATAPRGTGRRDYGLAHVLLVLSLLAKASAIIMPALLLLLDLGPLRAAARERGWRTAGLEKLPSLAIVSVFAIIAWRGQAVDAAMAPTELHTLTTRTIQAGYAACFYAVRSVWPVGLSPIHPMPPIERFYDAALLLPFFVTLVTTLLALLFWRRRSAAAWSWCAFLVILAPVSGLAHSGPQLVAERYTYLACVPFALLAAGALAALSLERRALALTLAAVVLGSLCWKSREQSRIWIDTQSLWHHALSVDPDNNVALENLGVYELELAQKVRDPARSLELLRSARARLERAALLRAEPRRLFSLAATHVRLAESEPTRRAEHVASAVRCAGEARALAAARQRRVEPRWALIHAVALYNANRRAEAAPLAEEAYAGMPRDAEVARLVGNLRLETGRVQEALALFESLARADRDNSLWWYEIARAHERAGDAQKSREAAREGRRLADKIFGARAVELSWYAELVRRSQ
ncbi:MAG: tetratricopeptide repeat protein [Planctomycetes bacterium]|nr:tetratricopeptide repeat protein [Planctomycetota bacterium]